MASLDAARLLAQDPVACFAAPLQAAEAARAGLSQIPGLCILGTYYDGGVQHSLPGQGPRQPGDQGPGQPCNLGARQPSNLRTDQPGNQGTNQPGNLGTNQPGNLGTNEPSNQGTNQPGNYGNNQPGNQGTNQPGQLSRTGLRPASSGSVSDSCSNAHSSGSGSTAACDNHDCSSSSSSSDRSSSSSSSSSTEPQIKGEARGSVSAYDPLRLTVGVSQWGMTGFEVADLLERCFGVVPELATQRVRG